MANRLFSGAVVTIFAVIGIMPYIALQLKAVAHTFDLLSAPPERIGYGVKDLIPALPPYLDTAFIVALLLGLFGVLFGARHLDASERHEGLVAAIALESLVKIFAFVAVGIFVTYGLFDGFADIFQRFLSEFPDRLYLLRLGTPQTPYAMWFSLTFISMMAVMFLPRQFHIMVIENSDEEHIRDAMWRFPAYMFLINLFVIPIALGGILLNHGDATDADYFVLSLPLQAGHAWLALIVFIGGFSASAGMVMVSSVTLSTMILNHLVMPVILKLRIEAADISGLLINIKRVGIMAVIFLGYFYYRIIGESYALVTIGLVSFMAATQFAPADNRRAFLAARHPAGRHHRPDPRVHRLVLHPADSLLRPFRLAGRAKSWRTVFSASACCAPWSFSALPVLTSGPMPCSGRCFSTSAPSSPSPFSAGRKPAKRSRSSSSSMPSAPARKSSERKRISKAPTIMEFVDLMTKFIGEKQAHAAIAQYLGDREIDERGSLSEYELPSLKRFTERTLAGSVGAAPARIIIENYLATRGSRMEDVFDIFGSVTLSRTASREQLSVLFEAARMVASGAELQVILDDILDLLVQQFKFDLCVIRSLDEPKENLIVQAQKGMSPTTWGNRSGNDRWTPTSDGLSDQFGDRGQRYRLHRHAELGADHSPGRDQIVCPCADHHRRGSGGGSFRLLPLGQGNFHRRIHRTFQESGRPGRGRPAQRLADRQLIEAREQERELQIAKTIQLGLLPTRTPEIPGVALAGRCMPARQVGGDYYDFLPRGENSLDLVIADVSGHNVGAALIMAETRTFIQARAQEMESASEIMPALNEFFFDDLTRAELFITMFYLRYEAGYRPPEFRQCRAQPSAGLAGAERHL